MAETPHKRVNIAGRAAGVVKLPDSDTASGEAAVAQKNGRAGARRDPPPRRR